MEKAFYICGKVFLYIWKKKNKGYRRENKGIKKDYAVFNEIIPKGRKVFRKYAMSLTSLELDPQSVDY